MAIKREQQLRQANHLRSRRRPKCASCWTKCRFALVAGICLLLLAVPVHSRALADDEESNNSNSNGNALSDSSQQQSELDNNSSQQQQQRGADDSCDIHRSDPVHALMDRICELCHDMFSHQHPNTRAECRSGCFRSHSFKQCLKLFKPGRSQQKRRPVRTLVPSPEAIFVLDQQQQN